MAEDSPVIIPYSLLLSPDETLTPFIRRAFSSAPTALGLILISDLPPSFPALRKRLLLLSNAFAQLPEETRERYADPSTAYSYGWSQGKEVMNGKPDTLKGSYYNNPTYDETPGLTSDAPSFKNIWPKDEEGCEGYEEAFKALCKLMVDVGVLVARACEEIVQEAEGLASQKSVEELVGQSKASKARLLHYFPREGSIFALPSSSSLPAEEAPEEIDDSWCGTHIDHSLLTVLCPSMYLFHPSSPPTDSKLEPLIIPAPSKSTGLFIKTRAGKTIQATIPENCLALQTGETLELLSSNRLAATPHFVNSTASSLGRKALEAIERNKEESAEWKSVESGVVSRETLAVFLQPNKDEIVSPEGETFGDFSARVRRRHYVEAK